MLFRLIFFFLFCCLACVSTILAQTEQPGASHHTIVAGKQYGRSALHQWLWGKHYRQEWITPVQVPVFYLDSLDGGLSPYQRGGGRQSKTLRLRNPAEKEYVLRSVDKTFGRALPEIFRGSFVERLIDDQVSIGHPYAALTVPPLAEAARIYHARPVIGYVPKQDALGEYNNDFGDETYLLEQRPDENWEEAENFGNAAKIIGTEKLLTRLGADNDNRVDQQAFLRTRLFDLFIGDWGRHEDQWRWAKSKTSDQRIFTPIPRDRDQTYTVFDGFLLKLVLSGAGLGHLQSFDHTIKDIERYTFSSRNLDRHLLNALTSEQWIATAKELEEHLTDEVIDGAIKNFPPEVYSLSGPEIADKLKSRRTQLQQFARSYYRFLAKEVDVSGSRKNEFFHINRRDDGTTVLKIYKIGKAGDLSSTPLFERMFHPGETGEIRIYGLAGNDRYLVEGNVKHAIDLRIIGGTGEDSISIPSVVTGNGKTLIYDNPANKISASSSTRLKISADTAINAYKYEHYKYDKRGLGPVLFFNFADRLHVGLAYKTLKHKWRREPFAYQHRFAVHYSLNQNAFNLLYAGTVNQFVGKWNLQLNAHYDFVRWTNFFGVGNETEEIYDDQDYYRMRTRDALALIGLHRPLGKHSAFLLSGFLQGVQIINDRERFLQKEFSPSDKQMYDRKIFNGVEAHYSFQRLNDMVVPTRGAEFSAGIRYIQNMKERDRIVTRYDASFNFLVPVLKNLVLAVRNGAATLSGKPEIYQLNPIGGSFTLRGYRRDRFWGKTAFYNSNELQWLFNFRSRLFNGKAGIVGLVDNGRVWQPGEESKIWHTAVGGGVLFAPFNKLALTVTYAKAPKDAQINLRVGRSFR